MRILLGNKIKRRVRAFNNHTFKNPKKVVGVYGFMRKYDNIIIRSKSYAVENKTV